MHCAKLGTRTADRATTAHLHQTPIKPVQPGLIEHQVSRTLAGQQAGPLRCVVRRRVPRSCAQAAQLSTAQEWGMRSPPHSAWSRDIQQRGRQAMQSA